ncbi:MAG: hypothetical protein IEMM0008_0109 [bacterium]|nr:MAG: hypothetical protein IEMM0008_0109 [bacterium]
MKKTKDIIIEGYVPKSKKEIEEIENLIREVKEEEKQGIDIKSLKKVPAGQVFPEDKN